MVREWLDVRPVGFDVVLQCGACADACAGAGRGTLEELISSLSEEERQIVACVLRKLDKERCQEYQVVYAVLCELAGVAGKRSQCSNQFESTRKTKKTYIEAGKGT